MNRNIGLSLKASVPTYLLLALGLLLTWAMGQAIPHLFQDGAIFSHLLNEHDRPVALAMLALLVAALFPLREAGRIERGLAWLAARPIAVAAGLGLTLAAGARLIYQAQPLSMDEYSAVFQAEAFAAGSLSATYPVEWLGHFLDRVHHSTFFAINWTTGEIASSYWPGFALLLTPFAALGLPWLGNPLIVALSVIALHRLAVVLGMSSVQIGWVMLFAVASPAFTLNGISFYSMPAHLLLNTLFAICLVTPTRRNLFLGGLIGGYALCLHNPLPHLAFALPWIVWQLASGERRWQRTGWLLAGYLPFSLLLGLGWVLVTREITQTPPSDALAMAGTIVPHAKPLWASLAGYVRVFSWPSDFILISRVGGFIKLWTWGVPLMLLLAVAGAFRRTSANSRLLAASALTTWLIYYFTPFDQGHGWGYRYFHSAWGTLPLLAAMAMGDKRISAALATPLAICALGSLLLLTPLRTWQMADFVAGHLEQMPRSTTAQAANECEIVFHTLKGYYSIDLIQNRPRLGDCRLVLISRGKEADMALALSHSPGGREVAHDAFGWIYRYERRAPPSR